MNILYCLGEFPKLSESFVLNEIYELVRHGHKVAICSWRQPESDIVHEEFDKLDIPIEYVSTPTARDVTEVASTKLLHPRVLKETFYRAPLKNHAANLYRAKQVIDFVESLDWGPDHVHSHFATLSKFAGKYAASYFDIPFTVTTHAVDIYREPVEEYTSALLRGTTRIVTISEYNRQYLQQEFDPDVPIDIVRAGIRPEKFSPTAGTHPSRILTVSRMVEKKGLSYALDAVGIVSREIPNLEYHIVGSGELESNLVRKVEALGLEDTVSFLDNVSDQRLITELDEARCFLLPCVIASSGDRDGIPVVLMEAMAMKTPVVSTTVSGIPELVDHEQNGLLTEPRNEQATADAIMRLLDDASDWDAYAKQAREKVAQKFNIETEANKLEATFRAAGTDAGSSDR